MVAEKIQNEITLNDIADHEDFTFAFSTFLDMFKLAAEKQKMIETPPSSHRFSRVNLCLLAATAHKLANDYGVTAPSWVHSQQYKMPQPVFAFDTQNSDYQAFLLENTLPEFASRNLFYGANVISRV